MDTLRLLRAAVRIQFNTLGQTIQFLDHSQRYDESVPLELCGQFLKVFQTVDEAVGVG